MMKTKIFALALAASMSAGAAFAQTAIEAPAQSGGSEATPEQTQRGAPELPGDDVMTNFYTDNTMASMRSDDEINTYWGGLTPEEQERVRAGCSDEFIAKQRDVPETTLNVCRRVNAM